jgi:imidazole glycerol-phosphate synthase subunit HisH
LIKIVNYGLGNIQAFANIYKRLNIDYAVANLPEDLLTADRIILPGVGAFDWAMALLNESGMRDVLDELAVKRKIPVLGICVGMQIMARSSEEGSLPGLSWIDAEVRKFKTVSTAHKNLLPHMGWNDVSPRLADSLFKGLETDARYYFLHSYYFDPCSQADILADTDYNGRFASAVNYGNVYGVQFHPEKSHQWGIRLLKNFAEM